MDPAINNIKSVIENFSNIASQNQIEGISKIVDKFINEMSGSLSDKFQEFANTIDTICNWQITLKQSLDDFIKLVMETTQNQMLIYSNSTEILNNLNSNLKLLEDLNTKTSENLDFTIKIQDTFEQQIETFNIGFEKVKEEYHILIDNIEKIDQDISLKITNFLNSIEKVKNSIENIDTSLIHTSDAISKSSQDFMQKIKNGLETSLSLIDTEVSKITENFTKVLLNINTIMSDINITIENLHNSLSEALSNIEISTKKS